MSQINKEKQLEICEATTKCGYTSKGSSKHQWAQTAILPEVTTSHVPSVWKLPEGTAN